MISARDPSSIRTLCAYFSSLPESCQGHCRRHLAFHATRGSGAGGDPNRKIEGRCEFRPPLPLWTPNSQFDRPVEPPRTPAARNAAVSIARVAPLARWPRGRGGRGEGQLLRPNEAPLGRSEQPRIESGRALIPGAAATRGRPVASAARGFLLATPRQRLRNEVRRSAPSG